MRQRLKPPCPSETILVDRMTQKNGIIGAAEKNFNFFYFSA